MVYISDDEIEELIATLDADLQGAEDMKWQLTEDRFLELEEMLQCVADHQDRYARKLALLEKLEEERDRRAGQAHAEAVRLGD